MGNTTHTREELIELCRTDPEQAVEMMVSLEAAIKLLEERIQQLEEQLKQNSHNSHKPPSSDGLKRVPQTVRPKSNRPSGGQKGHRGTTLKMVDTPDHIVTHTVGACRRCGRSLQRIKARSYRRRQVFDIPVPRLEVTEHRCAVKQCPRCGTTTTASFPAGITKAAEYGKNLKSFAMYLQQHQLLPSDRLQETLRELFGCSLSEGTLFNWEHQLHNLLEMPEQEIKEQISQAPVIHTDETGMYCEATLHWLHAASTEQLTYYALHPKRGTAALNAIGILPEFDGVAVHDFWKPYLSYDCQHALCNAHLIRELEFFSQTTRQRWPEKFKELFYQMHHAVENAKERALKMLKAQTLRGFERRYDDLLAMAFRSNPRQRGSPHRRGRKKQSKARNLLERLRDYRASVLAFLYDFRVPFTNNQVERDIRMMKVKQKISGTFRSRHGADAFCRVRGYLSTARKNGLSAFDALLRAFDETPFIPKTSYAE